MRADEAMALKDIRGTWLIDDVYYINQLRVDRLMAKAREFRAMFDNKRNWTINHGQCLRIAESLEARAKRIKEGM